MILTLVCLSPDQTQTSWLVDQMFSFLSLNPSFVLFVLTQSAVVLAHLALPPPQAVHQLPLRLWKSRLSQCGGCVQQGGVAQRLPLVGLRGKFGDTVSGRHGRAIQGEEGERRGWEGHFPGGRGGAWGDSGGGRNRGWGGGTGGGADVGGRGGGGGKEGLRQQVTAWATLRWGEEVQGGAERLPRRQGGGAVRGRRRWQRRGITRGEELTGGLTRGDSRGAVQFRHHLRGGGRRWGETWCGRKHAAYRIDCIYHILIRMGNLLHYTTLNKNINPTLVFAPIFHELNSKIWHFFYPHKKSISLKYCSKICPNLCQWALLLCQDNLSHLTGVAYQDAD